MMEIFDTLAGYSTELFGPAAGPVIWTIVKYLVLNLDPKLGCPVSCTAVVG